MENSAILNGPGLVNWINKLIIEYSKKFEPDIENEKKEQVEIKTPNNKKKKKCCWNEIKKIVLFFSINKLLF